MMIISKVKFLIVLLSIFIITSIFNLCYITYRKAPSEITTGDSKERKKKVFLNALALKESSGRYNIKSRSGSYLGAYQIGRIAFKELKFDIHKFGVDNFLNSREVQDSLVVELFKKNKHYLKRYIKKYNGKTINGIKITESGIIAGGHIGIDYVKKFFDSGGAIDPADGNGTKVSYYIKHFSGYDVSFIDMNFITTLSKRI